MVSRIHSYRVRVTWTGNRGSGTAGYRAYSRDHDLTADAADGPAGGAAPHPISGSSDPAFRGDPGRWNPEQLLTAALAQCHMLAYLHLCADAGVVVTAYTDHAVATMSEGASGGGRFTEATLRPHVTVSSPAQIEKAVALHREASARCFIASSVSFPVRHEPVVTSGPAPAAPR